MSVGLVSSQLRNPGLKPKLYLDFSVCLLSFLNLFELVFLWFESETILTDDFENDATSSFLPQCSSFCLSSNLHISSWVYWHSYSFCLLVRHLWEVVSCPSLSPSRIPSPQVLQIPWWKYLIFCLKISRSSFKMCVMKYFRPKNEWYNEHLHVLTFQVDIYVSFPQKHLLLLLQEKLVS